MHLAQLTVKRARLEISGSAFMISQLVHVMSVTESQSLASPRTAAALVSNALNATDATTPWAETHAFLSDMGGASNWSAAAFADEIASPCNMDAFNLAVTGLRQALTTGDLQRAARFHTAAIRRALALKHRLADETLTSLIYLLFELVTAPVTVALPVHTRIELLEASGWKGGNLAGFTPTKLPKPKI